MNTRQYTNDVHYTSDLAWVYTIGISFDKLSSGNAALNVTVSIGPPATSEPMVIFFYDNKFGLPLFIPETHLLRQHLCEVRIILLAYNATVSVKKAIPETFNENWYDFISQKMIQWPASAISVRIESADMGHAWNWPLFPLVAFRLGDTGSWYEYIHFKVGPLICEQGKQHSYIYIIYILTFRCAVWFL